MPKQPITLTRSGILVRMCPWLPIVEPLLQYDYVPFDDPRGAEKRFLFHLDGENGYFPSGFEETITEFFIREGIAFTFTDERDRSRLFKPFQWDRISELRPGQREVLEAIEKHDHGTVVCSTGFGKSFLIGELTKGFPDSRFIIAAPRIAETRNLHNRLKEILPRGELGLLGAGSKDPSDRRVTVSVSNSLGKADFNSCDFFLFDEAHMCGHNSVTTKLLAMLGDSRNYGLTATPQGRSDKSDRVIEALFGREIARFDYQDCVNAGNVTQIHVAIYDIPGDVPSSHSQYGNSFIQNKRRFYWRNEIRNLTIACVAREVPPAESVLIMVESVDHLIHLAALLPEFAIVCGDGNDLRKRAKALGFKLMNRTGDNKEESEGIYNDFRSGKLLRVIATGVYRQGVDFPSLSVLIRADGSPSPIASGQIPGRLSRLSPGKTQAVLVDFRDMFNPNSLRNYYARMRTYKANGWPVEHRGEIL